MNVLMFMKIIQGVSRHQMQFSSLDDLVTADNPVRIIDGFVEKLDIERVGIKKLQSDHADV